MIYIVSSRTIRTMERFHLKTDTVLGFEDPRECKSGPSPTPAVVVATGNPSTWEAKTGDLKSETSLGYIMTP